MKAVDDGGNPPASSPGRNAIEQNGVENPDLHDFANDGGRELTFDVLLGRRADESAFDKGCTTPS
jgi:hypothetical protein